MNEYEENNRKRLLQLLSKVPTLTCPVGWRKLGRFAVGGLTEIGFSRSAEFLLIVSSSGRGVIDCASGTKVARDEEENGDWYKPLLLVCEGIGPIDGESVQIAGLSGGGLPTQTRFCESLELVAPEWPKFDLIFCAPYKSPFIDRHQDGCVRVASDYIQAYGFSHSGNSFAYATSSDVTVFSRLTSQAFQRT